MSAKVFLILLSSFFSTACSSAATRSVISAENWSTVPVEWRNAGHWTCTANVGLYTEYDGSNISKNLKNIDPENPETFTTFTIDMKKMTVEYDVGGEWPEHAIEYIVIANNRPKSKYYNNFPQFSFITTRFDENWLSYSLVFSSSRIARTNANGDSSWVHYGKCLPA